MVANLVANPAKNVTLDLRDPVLGPEYLLLPFFQLRRGVSFRIRQRLPAFIVFGHTCKVTFGDLDVVPENVVESYLQIRDPGTLALAVLECRDRLLAGGRDIAKFVQFAVKTSSNDSAIGGIDRSVRRYRSADQLSDLGQFENVFRQHL